MITRNKMIKKVKTAIILSVAASIAGGCTSKKANEGETADNGFVTVENGEFMLHGKPYRYVGTNLWYAGILGSEGVGGNRARLEAELDSLQALGVDNLRILAGGDGNRHIDSHIEPTLQTAPGEYNQDLLVGLDYVLDALEKRDMRAVIYLNNAWEWSGGYGTYLEWAGRGEAPVPLETSYPAYMEFVSAFVTDSVAKSLYANHVRNIVGRTNSITGKPYSESPAIMSWQIANEPRCFNPDNKQAFEDWLTDTGRLIKSIDANHLVSTGSEGSWGCEGDIELWARIHNSDAIDYANIHIWPYNWSWAKPDSLTETLPVAKQNTLDYIREHRARTAKPIVLEEFGFPRDGMANAPGSPTTARDEYYNFVFDLMTADNSINGANFWGWGGMAVPAHENWQPGDDYTGDPAQEAQGLNSVFAIDRSTLDVIRKANEKIHKTTID